LGQGFKTNKLVTLDARRLPLYRDRNGGRRTIRRIVPVRTFADWNDPLPGYVEGDLVAHSGMAFAPSLPVQHLPRRHRPKS
jgi:hypothetical protein